MHFEREIQICMLAMSQSAEPSRKKAYSNDLRWRIVYQRIAMNLSFQKVADNLNVSTSTAHRIFSRFMQTSQVDPATCSSREDLRKLDEQSELHVIGLVLEAPALYLGEVCKDVLDLFGVAISPSTICRLLSRYGITRKKIRQVATQRCEMLRGQFMSHCFLFKREMFVWADETGVDKRNHIRKFGYSLRGQTPVCHRLLTRGKKINAIAAMSSDGMIAVETTSDTVNGETFFDFLRGTLIPQMMP